MCWYAHFYIYCVVDYSEKERAFGHENQCQIYNMVDQNGENALARAYPVSDARDHRPGSATNGQGLPPGGRRRLKKLVQGRGKRLRKLKLASMNVGSYDRKKRRDSAVDVEE